jgi:hypothetical protein
MDSEEYSIAFNAINAGSATTFDELISRVSASTEIPTDRVKEVLDDLTSKFIVRRSVTPARNVGAEPPKGNVQAWYEKGDLWRE